MTFSNANAVTQLFVTLLYQIKQHGKTADFRGVEKRSEVWEKMLFHTSALVQIVNTDV